MVSDVRRSISVDALEGAQQPDRAPGERQQTEDQRHASRYGALGRLLRALRVDVFIRSAYRLADRGAD